MNHSPRNPNHQIFKQNKNPQKKRNNQAPTMQIFQANPCTTLIPNQRGEKNEWTIFFKRNLIWGSQLKESQKGREILTNLLF